VHDESERDRKRGDGDFRNRRVAEPPLAIHIQLPEDEKREEEERLRESALKSGVAGVDGGSHSDGAGSDDDHRFGESAGDRGDGGGLGGVGTREGKLDGAEGAREVWALVEEEVGVL